MIETTGRRRFAMSDWPIRIVQTLPTPTNASSAMATWAGRIVAAAVPAKTARAQLVARPPSTTRPYMRQKHGHGGQAV